MASKVGILNLALGHLGIDGTVANMATESSEEAIAGRMFYDVARDEVLRGFPWPFATRFAILALVEVEPTTEWGYSYRYPSDCLNLHRILSGIRNDTRQSRAPFKIASDTAGQLIYTDEEDAEIEYTAKDDDPSTYPSDFTIALSFYLASLMAPRLTGGDQFKLGDKALKNYVLSVSIAASRASNEDQAEEVPESEFIITRG